MEEIYKKIEEYEKYEVSNLGNVRNIDTGRILKPGKNGDDGYYFVILSKDRFQKNFYIHRLVGFAFIPNPQKLTDIDHIDRNKTNNSIPNLRWISKSNNLRNRTKFKNSSSKYMGVYFDKREGKYQARIKINNKHKHIGYYEKEEDAAHAFDNFVKLHNLTEFYNLNFPNEVTETI